MRDELQYAARRVFAEFVDAFERRHGQRGWVLSIDEEDLQRMGLNRSQVEGALDLLKNEGMIDAVTLEGGYELTDDGYRACVHRELIDDTLGSPAGSRGLSLQVIAQQVIIGNNNTLQVNSDEVIAKLIDHITADKAIEPEKKKRWLEVLKDVGGHVLAEGLKILIDKAGK